LFFYKDIPKEAKLLRATLPEIDYLFTDCYRDFKIAQENGFQGKFLGVFPGGGGFDLEEAERFLLPYENRNFIVVKGYQGVHGKCIEILKALSSMRLRLQSFKIVIFGADEEVIDYTRESELAT